MRHILQPNSQYTRAGRISRLARLALGESRGSALLELALVVPVFTLLMAGGAAFGRMEYYSIETSNAARAGVAYAAQGTAFSTDNSAIQAAAQNDAPDLTSVATLTVTSNTVCQCDDAGVFTTIGTTASACASAASSCLSPSRVINYVQVNTSAPLSTIFKFPGLASSITLQGQAIMRIK
jgi:Flp pilus assembly protein TadG